MACLMVGNQAMARNQTTTPALSEATINSTSKSRVRVAWANAATPRGVTGCQANGAGESGSAESGGEPVGLSLVISGSSRVFQESPNSDAGPKPCQGPALGGGGGLALGGATPTTGSGYRIFMTLSTNTSTK